jgi:hypothetical protein
MSIDERKLVQHRDSDVSPRSHQCDVRCIEVHKQTSWDENTEFSATFSPLLQHKQCLLLGTY